MSRVPDPIAQGLARGWRVLDATAVDLPREIECDVAVVGTGAGGGVSADILTAAGLKVVMIEEGPLKSSRDFRMREAEAYPDLYQESGARHTADQAIAILQGRCVGGSTTVNWTSSFRTPAATLAVWRERFQLSDSTPEALAPWFRQAEQRLGIAPWPVAPNAANALLAKGMEELGLRAAGIARNVRDCGNLGYCGMGCPLNAKQSMLVTTIPAALDRGATLLTRARAQALLFQDGAKGRRLTGVDVHWLDAKGLAPSGRRTVVRARHVVLAGGAIQSPALLLRTQAPDPHGLVGKRTFLHPVVLSAAVYPERTDPWAGAPQTIYSDHFVENAPPEGPMGFKLEVAPMHPMLSASTLAGFGQAHRDTLAQMAHAQAMLALMRDGFHPESTGGTVKLRGDGTPVLDYPVNDYLFDAARRALSAMAEIQFAAGATTVLPGHEAAQPWRSWSEAKAGIAALPMRTHALRIASAHVMGGCPMAGDSTLGVVDGDGRHYEIENLSVHDGSVFPTSIGANPQLSIYGVVGRMAVTLATTLAGRPAAGLAGA